MNILFVVTQLEAGGAQRVALDLASELRGRGHTCRTVFMYRKHPAYEEHSDHSCIAASRPTTLAGYCRLIARLVTTIWNERPDAVVAFTHYASVVALPIAMLLGIRVRIASQQNPMSSYPRAARLLDRVLGTLGFYSSIVAVSKAVEESASSYSTRYRQRLVVVRNGSAFSSPSVRDPVDVHAWLGLGEHFVLAVAVGRLSYQKNHRVLLDALVAAPDWALVIAGEGDLRTGIEDQARLIGVSDRLRLPGNLSQPRLNALLLQADAFVMPSRFEGLSLALIEALGLALPIISSNIAAQREVLERDDGSSCAILCDPESAADWTAALVRLSDERERRRLSELAGAQAKLFSIAATADGYLQLMSDVLTRPATRRLE